MPLAEAGWGFFVLCPYLAEAKFSRRPIRTTYRQEGYLLCGLLAISLAIKIFFVLKIHMILSSLLSAVSAKFNDGIFDGI